MDVLSLEFEFLNNVVVCIVSSCPLISNSFNPFTNTLGIVTSAPTTSGITVTYTFYNFFWSLGSFRYLSLFSLSFIFILCSDETAKSIIRRVHFFVDYFWVWLTGRDKVIRLYLKIPDRFMRLIFQDNLWVYAYTICSYAIRRDLVSFLRFPFLCYVQFFSHEISLVCRLKYPYSYFSSNFCYYCSVDPCVVWAVSVISLFFLFFM